MKLYTYDHCPFCTRARMIFGLKNQPLDNHFLLNDDEATPISLIVTMACHGLAIFHFHFLDIKPLAMQRVLDWISSRSSLCRHPHSKSD